MFEKILEKAPSDCLCLLCISRLQVFITKTSINSAKCETTARAHDAFCPLTQAWRVNCPFPLTVLLHCQLQAWRLHCTIRAQTGLVITNRVRGFRYSFDFYIFSSFHCIIQDKIICSLRSMQFLGHKIRFIGIKRFKILTFLHNLT